MLYVELDSEIDNNTPKPVELKLSDGNLKSLERCSNLPLGVNLCYPILFSCL